MAAVAATPPSAAASAPSGRADSPAGPSLALLPILGGGALGWASLATRAVNLPAWGELAEAARNPRRGSARLGSSRSVMMPALAAIDASSGAVRILEPAIGAPVADVEVPVIIPGYLLPDDSLEEAAT